MLIFCFDCCGHCTSIDTCSKIDIFVLQNVPGLPVLERKSDPVGQNAGSELVAAEQRRSAPSPDRQISSG